MEITVTTAITADFGIIVLKYRGLVGYSRRLYKRLQPIPIGETEVRPKKFLSKINHSWRCPVRLFSGNTAVVGAVVGLCLASRRSWLGDYCFGALHEKPAKFFDR